MCARRVHKQETKTQTVLPVSVHVGMHVCHTAAVARHGKEAHAGNSTVVKTVLFWSGKPLLPAQTA